MAIFTNQATLFYLNRVTNSNVVTGEVLQTLTVTKTAVDACYDQDDTITYVVSLVNAGTTALNDLTIEDDLGAYEFNDETLYPLTYQAGSVLYFINGVLQEDPDVEAGPPLEISGITVPAGGNVLLIYAAQVNEFAPLGEDAAITNTVSVPDACPMGEVTAQETVSACQDALLSITKSVNPSVVPCSGTLTYTFVIQNSGNTEATAEDLVRITDTFDPILEDITVTFNGETWEEGTHYTYDEQTGEFETIPGMITVPAATYTQDPVTGVWTVEPGVATLVVTGTV